MKVKISFKRILTYLLIFTMALSLVPFGQAKSASAASEKASVREVNDSFKFIIGDMSGEKTKDVDMDYNGDYVLRTVTLSHEYAIPSTFVKKVDGI